MYLLSVSIDRNEIWNKPFLLEDDARKAVSKIDLRTWMNALLCIDEIDDMTHSLTIDITYIDDDEWNYTASTYYKHYNTDDWRREHD